MSELRRTDKGSAAELIAAAYLMGMGYHVYRCESAHAPFDLAIYADGKLERVEVKSLSHGGYCPQFGRPKNDEWDVLVVVDCEPPVRVFVFRDFEQAREAIRTAYGWSPKILGQRLPATEAS